jgi:hypothetical protein
MSTPTIPPEVLQHIYTALGDVETIHLVQQTSRLTVNAHFGGRADAPDEALQGAHMRLLILPEGNYLILRLVPDVADRAGLFAVKSPDAPPARA